MRILVLTLMLLSHSAFGAVTHIKKHKRTLEEAPQGLIALEYPLSNASFEELKSTIWALVCRAQKTFKVLQLKDIARLEPFSSEVTEELKDIKQSLDHLRPRVKKLCIYLQKVDGSLWIINSFNLTQKLVRKTFQLKENLLLMRKSKKSNEE